MGSIYRLFGGISATVTPDNVPNLFGRRKTVSPLVEMLHLEPSSLVCQMGTGSGHLTFDIARRLEQLGGGGTVFAAEFSDRLEHDLKKRVTSHRLNQRIRTLPLSRWWPGKLPLQDGSVDSFVSVNAMHYMKVDSVYWKEIGRVLKPGGRAIVAQRSRAADGRALPYEENFAWSKTKICLRDLGLQTETVDGIEGMDWVISARSTTSKYL